jgi:hypothetical protein
MMMYQRISMFRETAKVYQKTDLPQFILKKKFRNGE